MAGRIAGITIEIGAETTNLQKSLKGIDSSLKTTKNALKDVDKLLKLDPKNTDLLLQKQKLLAKQITDTKTRLDKLKEAQAAMEAAGVDTNSEEYQALQREIIATEQDLRAAEAAAGETAAALDALEGEAGQTADAVANAGSKVSTFKDKLATIKDGAKKAADGLKKAADATKKLSATAAAAVTAIGALGYKALTTADDLLTLAAQTGFTTDEIQKMQYASDRIDVSFEDIAGALKKFKSKVDPSNKSLQKLGVSTTNADGSLRDATDVFFDAVEALSKIENETEKDQLAMELFGKSADSLAGIIDDGGKALKEYGEEAEEAGLIMDEKTLKSLGAMNDEIDKLKAQGMATLIQAGAKALMALSPILQKVANAIGEVLTWISELSPQTLQIIVTVLALVAAISPLLTLLSGLATAIAFLASPIGVAIVAFAALIAIGVAIYKNWDKIKAKASEIAENVATNWNQLKTDVSTAMETVKTKVETVWTGLKTKVITTATSILNKVRTTFNRIKTAITTPFNTAKSAVEKAVETIKGLFPLSIGKIFSDIKLPHFTLTKGEAPYGWHGKGSMPSLTIDWYRKAMRNPIMLRGATIFGSMGDRLLGGGEAGSEVILSYDKLAGMMGSTNVNIVVNASPGMDETALAQKIQRVFVRMSNQRRAARA